MRTFTPIFAIWHDMSSHSPQIWSSFPRLLKVLVRFMTRYEKPVAITRSGLDLALALVGIAEEKQV